MISQIENTKATLRPYLRKYLTDNDIDISPTGMFKCISKMHSDSSPSCRLLPDLYEQQYYCYGCQATGDIFSAAHELEALPIEGIEFVHKNMYRLADKFGVSYDRIELTPEQIEQMEQYSFIRVVADLMMLTNEDRELIHSTLDYGINRGFSKKICHEMKIATVLDYDKFVTAIQKATGFTRQEVIDRGIKSSMFCLDVLTFTLFDALGRAVGFSGRWLDHAKGRERPKYVNSSKSCIFNKGELLYGLHIAKKSGRRQLNVFEGFGSVLSLYDNGHKAAVAVCGTSMTDEHVEAIDKAGFTQVNLVFDPDDAGRQAADTYMERLSGHEGMDVTLTVIPEEADITDTEDFVKTHGIGEFFKLKRISAFDFFLKKDAEDARLNKTSKVEFISKILGIIQNTSNRITRGDQIKALAEATNTDERDIRDELSRILNASTGQIKDKLQRTLNKVRTPDELLAAVDDVRFSIINSVGAKEERIQLGIDEVANGLEDLSSILRNKKVGIQGWKTGFTVFDYRLSGMPKPVGLDDSGSPIPVAGLLFAVAGAPQHCKSTLIQNLSLGLLENNDDICILYWSLDDSRERTLERMLSIISEVSWRKVTRREGPTITDQQKIDEAKDRLLEHINDAKLLIKDQSIGNTIPLLRRWIEITREVVDKPIMVIIDSFHKIGNSASDNSNSEYSAVKKHSQELKEIAQLYKVTILCSMELNKSQGIGSEPHLNHITNARNMEYDFDIIATIYNEWYDLEGNTNAYMPNPIDYSIMPMIKFNVRKSKDGGDGVMYFALNKNNFKVNCYTTEEMRLLSATEEAGEVKTAGLKITSDRPNQRVPVTQQNDGLSQW